MSTSINSAAITGGYISGGGSIQDIIENASSQSSADRKDIKQKKQMASDHRIAAFNENIGKLQEQKNQADKAAKKGFIGSLINNVISIVTTVLSMVMPALAPAFQAIGKLLQTVTNTIFNKLSQGNQSKAQQAQIDAQKFQQLAETESKKENDAEQDLINNRQFLENTKKKLEVALSNYQQANSAIIKA